VEAAHIGHLGSLEAIADEKASIAGGLRAGGTLVLPAAHALDSRLRAAAGGARIVSFGEAADADVRLLAFDGDASGSRFTADVASRTVQVRLGVPGRHMARNALAALAAALAMGVDVDRAAASLARFAAVAGRGATRPILGGRAVLLDESYNASAAAVRAALQVLAMLPARRRVVVLGDMLELGEAGPAEHLGLAPALAEVADLVFACGPLTGQLFDVIPPRIRGAYATDSAALAPLVAAAVAPGDAVLVKGSLGSRMRWVVKALEALDAGPAAGESGDAA
jgi:UDP-N-acetylmuramoyl-tripeptide--D-alanyl-D-alanine ligase